MTVCYIVHWEKVHSVPVLWRGAFTCVGWQVTLCDPIWQVTSRSCEMEFHWQLYAPLPFYFLCGIVWWKWNAYFDIYILSHQFCSNRSETPNTNSSICCLNKSINIYYHVEFCILHVYSLLSCITRSWSMLGRGKQLATPCSVSYTLCYTWLANTLLPRWCLVSPSNGTSLSAIRSVKSATVRWQWPPGCRSSWSCFVSHLPQRR